MSAFQAYAGAYEHEGDLFRWRCYATTRVHDLRRTDHCPLPPAPEGRTWMLQKPDRKAAAVAWLVDQSVTEFSQILLQVEPAAEPARGEPAAASVAAA